MHYLLHIKNHHFTTRTILLMVLVVICACTHKTKNIRTEAVENRDLKPALSTYNVSCLISDSGITRYRINTPEYLVFDKAHPAYWEFPQGIYLEKFDAQMKVDASLEADYAHFNDSLRLWTLRGNVKAMNTQGEHFATPLLYWSEQTARIYSDSSIIITKKNSIIRGVGFDSNQEMTKYTILHPTGVIPIEEEDSKESADTIKTVNTEGIVDTEQTVETN